jgi:hypothetical protein
MTESNNMLGVEGWLETVVVRKRPVTVALADFDKLTVTRG